MDEVKSAPVDQTVTPEVKGPDQSEAPRDRTAESESRLAQQSSELTAANSHIAELEQALAESARKVTDMGKALSQAMDSYRSLVMRANPGVLPELITGDTIGQVNESLERARAFATRIRQGIEAEAAGTKIPAGAPPRKGFTLSGLSPREKIQYAIGGKG
ncbi:MAG: hypothetical protein PHU08_03130 [Dehalococcoidales bacterium]|nr:hypothetical protein [Dehalococcoidales bacterium]